MDILSLAFPSSSLFFLYLWWKMSRVCACSVTHNLLMSKDGRYGSSQTRRGKGGGGSVRWKQMHQQYLEKVTRFPQGTCLSLKQTRKELMCALIRTWQNISGELPCGVSPPGVNTPVGGREGGLSQLLAGAPLSEICLSSSFLFPTKRLWLDIRLRRSIPLQTAGWPTSMLHIVKLLIKGLHA